MEQTPRDSSPSLGHGAHSGDGNALVSSGNVPENTSMLALLRPDWRSRAVVSIAPFNWALIPQCFEHSIAQQLAQTFPQHHLLLPAGDSSTPRFLYRSLIRRGIVEPFCTNLDDVWQRLLQMLLSPEYADALGTLMGISTRGLNVDAAICVYHRDHWLKPHTDREHRVLTQRRDVPVVKTATTIACKRPRIRVQH